MCYCFFSLRRSKADPLSFDDRGRDRYGGVYYVQRGKGIYLLWHLRENVEAKPGLFCRGERQAGPAIGCCGIEGDQADEATFLPGLQ